MTQPIVSDLWDKFAPEASPAQLAALDINVLTDQVSELRTAYYQMTSREIAEALQEYAREMEA